MTEQTTLEAFREKFRVDDLLVYANAHWSWSVRPAQPTLAAGVISLNRYALTLGEVTPEEMQALPDVVSRLEATVRGHFDHRIMNYLALMMVDHHVHWHVIPRYDSPRTFAGREWVDSGWPRFPAIADSQHGDDAVLHEIRRALRGD